MKQFFNQSSIGQRMGWAFGFVVISSLAVSLVSRSVLHEVSDTTQRLVDEHMAAISDIGRIKDNLGQVARSSRNLLLLDQASELQTERTTIAQALASNAQAYANLERRELDPRTRGLLKDIEASRQHFNDRLNAFLQKADAHSEDAKVELMQHLRPAQLSYMKATDVLADSEIASMKQAANLQQSAASMEQLTSTVRHST